MLSFSSAECLQNDRQESNEQFRGLFVKTWVKQASGKCAITALLDTELQIDFEMTFYMFVSKKGGKIDYKKAFNSIASQ